MSDKVNDYFKRFYPEDLSPEMFKYDGMLDGMRRYKNYEVIKIFPPMKMKDGFSVSVQGHYGTYSQPREDFAKEYTLVELGFPSEHEPLLDPYQEGADDPTNTVYGYVPIGVVEEIIEKHGGLT